MGLHGLRADAERGSDLPIGTAREDLQARRNNAGCRVRYGELNLPVSG
jgi:hypothetical protein